MIGLPTLQDKPLTHRSMSPNRASHTYVDSLKDRRILLAKYMKPKDDKTVSYSQLPQIERHTDVKLKGNRANLSSKDLIYEQSTKILYKNQLFKTRFVFKPGAKNEKSSLFVTHLTNFDDHFALTDRPQRGTSPLKNSNSREGKRSSSKRDNRLNQTAYLKMSQTHDNRKNVKTPDSPLLKLKEMDSSTMKTNDQGYALEKANLFIDPADAEEMMSYDPWSPIDEDIDIEDPQYGFLKPFIDKSIFKEQETDHDEELGNYVSVDVDTDLDYCLKFDTFRIPAFDLKDWEFLEIIGSGSSGITSRVYHKETLKMFALRTVNVQQYNNDLHDLKSELAILKLLTQNPHKNILKLLCSKLFVSSVSLKSNVVNGLLMDPSKKEVEDGSMNLNMIIVTDLCLGSLQEICTARVNNTIPWPEQELLTILRDMSGALAHAEKFGIAHRNLKPSNILIAKDKMTYKLTNFRSSIILEQGKRMVNANIVGTPKYMSPELKAIYNDLKIQRSTNDPSNKLTVNYDPFLSDVYSLGMVLLEMLVGHYDFEPGFKLDTDTSGKVLKKIVTHYPNLHKILTKMVVVDYRSRYRFSEIYQLTLAVMIPSEKEEILRKRFDCMYLMERLRMYTVTEGNTGKLMSILKNYLRLYKFEEEKLKLPKVFKDKESEESLFFKNKYSFEVIRVLNSSRIICHNSMQYQRAIEFAGHIRELFSKIKGTENLIHVAIFYNSIGLASQKLTEWTQSKKSYDKGLQILEDIGNTESIIYAKILNNEATLLMAQKEYDAAYELLRNSLKIKQENYAEEVKTNAIGFYNIGISRGVTEHSVEARESFQAALACYVKAYGEHSQQTAICLTAIGKLFYSKLNDYNKAKDCFMKSLEILKNIYKNGHWLIAMAYYNLALLLHKNGLSYKSLKLLTKAEKLLVSLSMDTMHLEVIQRLKGIVKKNVSLEAMKQEGSDKE